MPPLHFSVPRSARSGLLPFAVAGLLLVSGCSGSDGPTSEELEEMLASDLSASSSEAAQEPDAEEPRFDGGTLTCAPARTTDVEGAWETSAPRSEVSGGSAEIGLRDAEGAGEVPVSVSVTAPDEKVYLATATLSGSDWTTLAFPGDFEAGPAGVAPGAHTVVWSVGDDEAFVSCDGFVGAQ
ncbi:hypothetical protein [Actinorugispora endophytica]|uniref:Uncharacterized protein n=1 Tax=Actinorugispora endophytica TaxID=1605990 RepID=A0A4V3D948_9ACTN|nr:hypothetical protein [Actinorugispora endophytica]TDQ54700.1 hypothetical protein EV190_10113 [Actinorugispora endophytica]